MSVMPENRPCWAVAKALPLLPQSSARDCICSNGFMSGAPPGVGHGSVSPRLRSLSRLSVERFVVDGGCHIVRLPPTSPLGSTFISTTWLCSLMKISWREKVFARVSATMSSLKTGIDRLSFQPHRPELLSGVHDGSATALGFPFSSRATKVNTPSVTLSLAFEPRSRDQVSMRTVTEVPPSLTRVQ